MHYTEKYVETELKVIQRIRQYAENLEKNHRHLYGTQSSTATELLDILDTNPTNNNLTSRHEMGKQIIQLTNRLNQQDAKIERLQEFLDQHRSDDDLGPFVSELEDALNKEKNDIP